MKFVIQGHPQAKQRPRMSKSGHVYTPKETKEYEQLVGWIARLSFKYEPLTNPLSVSLDVYFKLPQRTSHTQGDWCMKNIDIDNISKSVLDGLNGIIWLDDKQVVELIVRKYWHKESKIEVEIKEAHT